MSAKYTFLAWDTPIDSAPLKLALLQLANNADDNGFSFYSISKMALACGMSERTFQRKIVEMEEKGILTVERRSNRPSLYNLIGDEMGVTLCHLQNSGVTESRLGVTDCHGGVTESDCGGDRESLVPNSTPNTSPKSNPNTLSSTNDCTIIFNAYNNIIDELKPNWKKCTSVISTRKSLIKSALKLVKPRAKLMGDTPEDYLIRLLGAMAEDLKFFSGLPTQRNPEGYSCSFETNFTQKRIAQAIDQFSEEEA